MNEISNVLKSKAGESCRVLFRLVVWNLNVKRSLKHNVSWQVDEQCLLRQTTAVIKPKMIMNVRMLQKSPSDNEGGRDAAAAE